jgi:thiol-disulfide isomerase/thioredoxin
LSRAWYGNIGGIGGVWVIDVRAESRHGRNLTRITIVQIKHTKSNQPPEFSMILTRRVFSGAALALVAGGLLSSAWATTSVPFSAEAFKAAQASGAPILVEIHADWCTICKAQTPILDKLTADPKFKDMKVFRVDFDAMKPVVKEFGAQMQSTLIVFKGSAEQGRSVGDSKQASIAALLDKSL